MDILRRTTVDKIQKKIIVPNPGKKEGKRRECVSREIVNGWKNQLFTSDDYPDEIPAIYTGKNEEDPGNGECHPLYVVSVITEPLELFGKVGWYAWMKEFDRILRTLFAQKGIANIRCAKESDFEHIKKPEGKFWLPNPIFTNDKDGLTHFYMRYMNNGKIATCDLYHQDGEGFGGHTGCGLLAAISLDTVIVSKDVIESKPRGLWDI